MWKKIVALGVVLLTVLMAGCTNTGTEETGPTGTVEEEVIKVGTLVDFSGPLSTHGIDTKNNLELAKEDIEKYFKEHNMPYRIEILPEDTRLDPNLALQKIQLLKGKGVNIFVGPLSSSEVKTILPYTLSNKIIVISPSSTALPPLIGATSPEQKKYLYRFVASDDLQGMAIASLVADMGIEDVVILYRDDAWGKGLSQETRKNLPKYGVNVVDYIAYPSNPSPADWSPYITKVEEDIRKVINSKGKDKVGVIYIGFEEGATLFSQIPEDSILLDVKWIGSDGIVKSDKLLELKDKTAKVGMYSTIFESEGPEEYVQRYKKRFGGTPTSYGLISYDALWVLTMAYVDTLKANNGKYDADIMTKKIKEVIEKYNNGEYGVKPLSGKIVLNEFNDRASGDYAIYMVTEDGWKKVGIWRYDTKKVEWIK
ncbi:MAG TPA: ABC transporter substrate-binding protein [Methanothermococcus okinawensis]|uniref:ABC transporter substrate-binding protein n=1 Tax=Methanothermococcus okinawensis TaxID=155863 RepID=A0A833E4K3_9EURY|nr:ABC transporter substrate-binding protein [Methanococcaceae archaeon]HIP83926.1 ABC transporter substrate-binding protein [Methanothermococcus okinawensis]HIP91760.1 ABC transporter substrate-binding protein [Methanothermococcus okinawensis]